MWRGTLPWTPPSRPTGYALVVPQKLQPPSPTGLTRIRLHGRLREALLSGQVLVVAPPGAGKTTLMSQVAASSGLDVVWYSAGAEEAREAVLVQYLARALWRDTPPPIGMNASVDELLAAVGDGRQFRPLLLAIDDLHELADTPAERALERFLECRPAIMHVLLGSRRPPGFNTPRMMASGNLVEFDGDDLRFRSWEVEELFRDIHHQPLSPEAAALLTRRVGGLAAALQLFHLSTRGRSRADREAQIRQLSGRSPLIRSYLARTVLDSLRAGRRDFLVRTSVLGILDGPLCDALLGRTGSSVALRELARDQLFTTTRDGGLTYRYHQVLRNHLEVTLEDELPAAEVTGLHQRAAELLEAAGHDAEAVRAYERAGDWGSAGRLVAYTRAIAASEDPAAPARSSGRRTPDDPWLALGRARRLIRLGSIEAGLLALENIERSIDDPDLARLCAFERLHAGIWRPGPLRLSPALTSFPLAALRALTHQPDARLPGVEEPQVTGPGHLLQVLSKVVAADFTAARAIFGRTFAFGDSEPWVRLTAGLIDVVIDLTEPDGASRGAARLEDLSLTADVEGYPWLARIARGLQACVLLEASGQLWHRAACDGIVDACVGDGDHWGELLLRIFNAVVLARLGNLTDARVGLERAAHLCRDLDAPMLGRWVYGFLTELRKPGLAGADAPQPMAALAAPSCPAAILAACRTSLTPRAPHRVQLDQVAAGSRLECLGGFRLVRAGRITDLSALRPRARLLLMQLAMQHHADVHREQLIDTLWPDVPLAPGLRRLQVAVSSIRQLLEGAGWGSNCLGRHGEAYRLELPDAEFDVQRLEAKVAEINRMPHSTDWAWVEQESSDLIELYRGELLPEVGAAEWVLPERDRLKFITASGLARLSRTGLELDRADLALAPAQRLVELDPLRDTAWLLLARIQRELGDHNAADATLAAYERVSAQLHEA